MPIWPDGCHDTNSCERNRICMYHQCRHTGKGAALGAEIDEAIVRLADNPPVPHMTSIGLPPLPPYIKVDESGELTVATGHQPYVNWLNDPERPDLILHGFFSAEDLLAIALNVQANRKMPE